jgi:L-alanine-DL-glutamate epimerase-like enolase superfamily enzyme
LQEKEIYPAPLRAALDIALWDLESRLKGISLEKLIDAHAKECLCFYTLGFSNIREQNLKLKDAKDFKVFKIKIGSENDFERIDALTKKVDVDFSVDANQYFSDVDSIKDYINYLKEKKCLFIEQPFAIDNLNELKKLYALRLMPIVLDESIQDLDDYLRLKNECDGINIKLVKIGGITPALDLIKNASADHKKIIIGCMSEGSCGAAAAASLRGFADWIDLDGPALIKNDPFSGVEYKNGYLIKNSNVGHGATLANELIFHA